MYYFWGSLHNGSWYKKNRGKSITLVKHYKTTACNTCPARNLCTRNPEGRLIERSEHAQYIEKNKRNIEANPQTYKRRQAIVEHPYGTIKRQWGFSYILTKKGIKRASADVGLMFAAYNLRRIFNLIDANVLKEYLRILWLCFLAIFGLFKSFLTNFKPRFFPKPTFSFLLNLIFKPLNSFYLNQN